MFRLFVFLLFSCSLSSFETTAITENDPSSFVEGVSIITGGFYLVDDNLVVQGAEPIRLNRAYISSLGKVEGYKHLEASPSVGTEVLDVAEPNGTLLCYVPEGTKVEQKNDQIEFKVPTLKKKGYGLRRTHSVFV